MRSRLMPCSPVGLQRLIELARARTGDCCAGALRLAAHGLKEGLHPLVLAAELGRGVDGVTLVDLGNLAKRMLQGEQQQQQQAEPSSSHCNRYLAKTGMDMGVPEDGESRHQCKAEPDARADKMRFDDLLHRTVTFCHILYIVTA